MDDVRKIKQLSSQIKKMKKIIYTLLVFQVIFITVGILKLFNGEIIMGIFQIVVNAIGILINLYTLKNINKK